MYFHRFLNMSNITEVLTTLIQEQKDLFQIEKRQKELVSYFLYTVHCWCLTRGVNLKHLFSAASLFQANVECLLSCQGFIVIRHYSSKTNEFWEMFQRDDLKRVWIHFWFHFRVCSVTIDYDDSRELPHTYECLLELQTLTHFH